MRSRRGMKFPGYITAPVETGLRVPGTFSAPLTGRCWIAGGIYPPAASHEGRLVASDYCRIIFLTFIIRRLAQPKRAKASSDMHNSLL